MKNRRRASLVSLIGLLTAAVFWLAASTPLSAQGLGIMGGPRQLATVSSTPTTFGTDDQTVQTIGIGHWDKPNDAVTWSTNVSSATGIQVYQTTGPAIDWWNALQLPNGAILDTIELEACDTTATGEIVFVLAAGAAPGGAATNVSVIATTGGVGIPGCAFFTAVPAAPLTIDNRNNTYWLDLAWTGEFSANLLVTGFRVFYRLQVSPAPGTATFADVPTSDPAFQFVEALVAAGITVGCGSGNYCPDATLTRRQMAVFLAKALGLHWPN